ncbi:hypothetical protein, partial [Enterobacter hormaechei]
FFFYILLWVLCFFGFLFNFARVRKKSLLNFGVFSEWVKQQAFFVFIRKGFGGSKPPHTENLFMKASTKVGVFLFYLLVGGEHTPRPGFGNWRQPVGQTE